ncbi:methyltransferase domain-containing protein [Ornithinimicrobium avium]|uniref:Methyltransferase domain-containing protein n=1 Tax=Ornithinimicrobium avium TaxID=2283195 RepID=A0A345NQ39_9MICO|nr:methyltransferase domain-containing protein [Ornithinimicrobium avium]
MPPTPVVVPALLDALREDLTEAAYTLEGTGEVLGERAAAALHREQLLPADLATRDSDEPAAALVRLFVLGLPVGAPRLAAALPRTGPSGLLDLGLARRAGVGDEVRGGLLATCDLRPYGDERHTWWLVSDLGEAATGGPLPTEHVLGVGGASTTLSSWTPRPEVDRGLDLGTGSGVQALHLSTHARAVVATDLSARALAFARFTAALNGIGLDLRQGSLLEPVAGETFDLVVSNPPFVITPRVAGVPVYGYRDGGATGDALVAGLVRELGAHLRPGGVAQLLANWELAEDEDWRDRVGGWLEGNGLDAWVVQREEQDVSEYAGTWVRDGGHRPGSPAFEELYAAWLADFAARGVERVGFGVVTLQRPATERDPWRDLVDVRTPVASPMGPAVLHGLHARTWLAEHTDDELLDVPWQVADDITEERVGRPGAPDPQVIQLRQGGGLRRVVRLDTLGAGFVGACDGELSAGQLCAGLAVLTEVAVDQVREAVLPVLRDLVKDGLLR